MEYIVVLLIIALIVTIYMKQPNRIYDVAIGSLLESLRNKEGEIVYGLYNKLPTNIKERIDSKLIAEIVGFTIGIIIDIFDRRYK